MLDGEHMKIPVYRLALKRERTLTLSDSHANHSLVVRRLAQEELSDAPHERMLAFFLSANHEVLGLMVMATNSNISSSGFTPKGILQAALTANASAVILAHNHPSGDPTPSREDVIATIKVKTMLAAIDTPLLDHVIVTRSDKFRSWSDDGEWS
jgi:DNA repair protein RadC